MKTRTIMTLIALLVAATGSLSLAGTPEDGHARGKKLLEYGWDVPYPDQVQAMVRQMEERPFDGLIFRLRDYNHAFDLQPWPREALEPQLAQLESIQWRHFRDNFLVLFAANRQEMDWFDDDHWRHIEGNLRLTAEAARRGGCVGIVFDPEPYGPNPWVLSDVAPGHDFASTAAQVRRRGAQFIQALQAELPTIRILSLYQLSVVAALFDVTDPDRLATQLQGHSYGLLPAFVDGMLDAIGPEARLIDGNEPAYYYQDESAFAQAYVALSQQAQTVLSPENRETYERQSQVGMAIYYDQVLNLRRPSEAFISHYLTPAQRLAFLEHNVYWSLATADEYAWLYSEKNDWWSGQIIEGSDGAVAAGRAKVAAGQPLGFELDSLFTRAEQQMARDLASRVEIRSASIQRRPVSQLPPVVDGVLGDPVWTSATTLSALQAPATHFDELTGTTTAKVLWDEAALYVAIDCVEPRPDQIVRKGNRRDDPIWTGDDVELLISIGEDGQYLHFMVNPDNVQWDARASLDGTDTSWDAQWTSAVSATPGGWTVEIRLPWYALGTDGPDVDRRVNLCRARPGGGELSCWSGVMRLFLEPERFGHWSFGR